MARELKKFHSPPSPEPPNDDDFSIGDDDIGIENEPNNTKPIQSPPSSSDSPSPLHSNNNNSASSSKKSPGLAHDVIVVDKSNGTPSSSPAPPRPAPTKSSPQEHPSPSSSHSPSHPPLESNTPLSTSTTSLGSSGYNSESESKTLSYNERLKNYADVFQSDIIEMNVLRNLAWQGIPETKGLRAKYWKVLLHYLPTNRMMWDSALEKSRKLYQDWLQELVVDPHKESAKQEEEVVDHPLSNDRGSKWNAFFKDNEILAEIDKDVKRTFPHLHFFNQISPTGEEIASPHYHVLKRVLFIYAKLNPGIRYVQGMNELLGPIYYTFATDVDPAFKEHAEADAFFCFTNLMSEVMDNFCKTLDKSEIGIVANMQKLNLLLKQQDLELWEDLEEKKLNPQFYSFRWITLLLSQEFELPDVLRLWDSLFADPQRFEFFYCFCCAMLICVRDKLLDGTFVDNLKLLQSYPPSIDFQVIFGVAMQVYEHQWIPPPPRKKTDTTPAPVAPQYTATSTSTTKLYGLFAKSPGTTRADKPPEKAKEKEKEKPQVEIVLPWLGKFSI